MPEPTPFIVRRDGTVVHRAAGHILGHVWIDPDLGWVGSTVNGAGVLRPYVSTRKDAARAVWEATRG